MDFVHRFFILILFTLVSCLNNGQITISAQKEFPSSVLTINQATTETVGSCSFVAPQDPTNSSGFSYRITYPLPIDPSTLSTADIINLGMGGSTALTWNIENCGDDQNFKLTATSVVGDGTIVPVVNGQTYKALDNSISFDNSAPSVTINQAISESVGSCRFNTTSDPTGSPGFSFRVSFSEAINASTFTASDIANLGTGGSTLIWSLTNCGDDRNFKLTASTVVGAGTIMPSLPAGRVADRVGNLSLLSTATDNSVTFGPSSPFNVVINQATTESVGSCSFTSVTEPTNAPGFSYKVTFSSAVDPSTFTPSDIVNTGSGGSSLVWSLSNCGDDQNFKLTATTVSGSGTIVPSLSLGAVEDSSGNSNTASTSTDNTIVFDGTSPTVSINQSIAESVGSCTFTAVTDPARLTGFSYRISFSEPINPATLTTSDIVNAGTGGSVTLTWALANCGDNQNLKLTTSAVAPDGTIIPTLAGGSIQDPAGNSNLASSATDNTVTFDSTAPTPIVNQATTETIGTCSFIGTTDPRTTAGFSYRVSFMENINVSSFSTADIVNSGTGGGTSLVWNLTSCGDQRNFMLTAQSISGDGTIVPNVALGSVTDLAGNTSLPSTSTDNTVTYDGTAPSVTVNRAITETVSSCSFTASTDPVSSPGFSYRIRFSERINPSTFTVADITNSGTGGSTSLTWSLTDCGDQTNYMLVATSVTGNGTIIPSITGSTVQDPAGNNNSASTATNNTVTYSAAGGWAQEAYIKASNANAGDLFGSAVYVSGNTLAVSAPGEQSLQTTITNGAGSSSDNSGTDVGAIYLYKRTGTSWTQEAFIKTSNAIDYQKVGSSLAIDGDTLAVGARMEASNQTTITNGPAASTNTMNPGGGAVYVYKRTGTLWAQEAFIKPSNSLYDSLDQEEYFGVSISLSGNILAVGASGEAGTMTTITNGTTSGANNGSWGSGAVFVYSRSGATWSQEAYIKPNNNAGDSMFGGSVSLSGTHLAVGASGNDSSLTTITNGPLASTDASSWNAGAVYVFGRRGVTWFQEAFIKASNTNDSDLFGVNVALSGDTLAVSAIGEDSNLTTITNGATSSSNNAKVDSGAVYVYRKTGATWAQESYIKTSNSDAGDMLGSAIALSGSTLVVSSVYESSNVTSITNGTGTSLDNSSLNAGAVYVFKRSGTTWAQEAYIKASNSNAGDEFGQDLSLSGDTLIVGAPSEDSSQLTITNGATSSTDNSAADSGAVYVYRNLSRLFEVSDLSYVSANTSITLNWQKTNGANDYKIVSQLGSTAIANCSGGVSTGDVGAYVIPSLAPDSLYSIRICATNGTSTTDGILISVRTTDTVPPTTATIALSVNETVGVCEFPAQGTLTSKDGIAYKVTFNETINASSFTKEDVVNSGSVASSDIVWEIQNCDDGRTFMLKAVSVAASGSISPSVSSGTFLDTWGNGNTTASASVPFVNYVFSGWYQEAYIKASNSESGDGFGSSLSISGDTIAVAAIEEDSAQTTITNGAASSSDNSSDVAGAVYVYQRSGTDWAQEAYIKASNAGDADYFGYDISLHQDTLAVGTMGDDSNQTTITNGTTSSSFNTQNFTGAVFVYKRTGSTWAQEAYIKASNANAYDQFGQSVSLSGNTIAVGAIYEGSNLTTITNGSTASTNNTGQYSGAVYVFKRTGTAWAQEAYMKASNSKNFLAFGSTLSLHRDTLVVGVPKDSSNQSTITNGSTSSSNTSNSGSGAAFVYKRTGSTWAQEAYIKAANNSPDDTFGSAVSVFENTLVVGSPGEDSAQTTISNGTTVSNDESLSSSGAAYVYVRTGTSWAQEAYIKASSGRAWNNFGTALKVNGDTLVVASIFDSSGQSTITNGSFSPSDVYSMNSGAAYVYKRTGATWAQEAYIKASNNHPMTELGRAVDISGDTIVVSAPSESSNETTITNGRTASSDTSSDFSGAVYVYRNNSRLFEVNHLTATPTSTSVALKWKMSGVVAILYEVAFVTGPNPPIDCTDGTTSAVFNDDNFNYFGLSPGTQYSFRVCASDGSNSTKGETITLTTLP